MMIVWFLAAGAFAGVCAGLFGVGGGMIIVPALVWIFTAYGYSPEIIAHLAVGTSLATIIVTSISSLTAHNKRGGVRWDVWKNMAIGLVIGSLLGAAIAEQIHGLMLQALIGAGALLIAFKMLFLSNKENLGKALPSAPVQVGAGLALVWLLPSLVLRWQFNGAVFDLGGTAHASGSRHLSCLWLTYCFSRGYWVCLVRSKRR